MSDSDPRLKLTTIPVAIREQEEREGVKDGMSTPSDAKGINLKTTAYYQGHDQKGNPIYVSGEKAINNQSIRQIREDIVDGKVKYYRQIDWEDGSLKSDPNNPHSNGSGLYVTAWEEIDKNGKPVLVNGKMEITFDVTGLLGVGNDSVTTAQALSGQLNPKSMDMADFTQRVIKEAGGPDKISDIKYTAHSFGAGQTLAADVVSRLDGIKTESILHLNPGLASGQRDLIEAALKDPNSEFFKKVQDVTHKSPAEIMRAFALVKEDLDKNTTTIYNVQKDEKGEYHTSWVSNGDSGLKTSLPGLGTLGTFVGFMVRNASQSEYDRVLNGTTTKDNSPASANNVYVQETKPEPDYHTTSAGGKLDPVGMLEPMTRQAQQGTYYQVVHTDGSELKTPSFSISATLNNIKTLYNRIKSP